MENFNIGDAVTIHGTPALIENIHNTTAALLFLNGRHESWYPFCDLTFCRSYDKLPTDLQNYFQLNKIF